MRTLSKTVDLSEFGTFTEQMWRDIGKSALHNNEGMRLPGQEVSKYTGQYPSTENRIAATHQAENI